MLNLPPVVHNVLNHNKNILIAAIGGGYDIFAALPLVYTLKEMGSRVYLSSYSLRTDVIPTYLVPETISSLKIDGHYPEKRFFEYLQSQNGFQDIQMYVSRKGGVKEMKEYYKRLLQLWSIDVIVTIDGGVDSLMHGTEKHCGTVMEEFINFAALRDINKPMIHSCIGMGAEIEEGIEQQVVFQRIAELAQDYSFLGCCALTRGMESFKFYRQGYESSIANAKLESHIHPRIIGSVMGMLETVSYQSKTLMQNAATNFHLSPLMSIQWFFDGKEVIKRNPFMDQMQGHMTILDTLNMIHSIPRT